MELRWICFLYGNIYTLPSKGTGANKVSFMGSFLLSCFASFQFHIEFASTSYVLQYWVKPLASLIWSLIKILFRNVYFILYFLFIYFHFFNRRESECWMSITSRGTNQWIKTLGHLYSTNYNLSYNYNFNSP